MSIITSFDGVIDGSRVNVRGVTSDQNLNAFSI